MSELAKIWQAAPPVANAESPQVKPNPWLTLVEDGADIMTEELPPLVEIIEGIVAQQSKLAIVSGAKSFKTWLTMHAMLCVAHGLPFLGHHTTRARVLYVNLELKPATFKRRLQKIAGALKLKVDPDWFKHLPLRGKLAGMTVNGIITRIIETALHFKADVVVVDPIFKLCIEGSENDTQYQTLLYLEIDRITTEAQATVILNDHSGKGNQSEKDPLDVARGSSAKAGDIDAAMVLRKHEVEGCFRVDLVHRELAPVEPFVIGWEYPLMTLRSDLDAEAMKKAKGGRSKVHDPLDLLSAIVERTERNPISIMAWATQAKVPRPTLVSYLPGMRSKDWIGTKGEGNNARQFITPKGRDAVQKHQEVTCQE